jgi:hypothetical protein
MRATSWRAFACILASMAQSVRLYDSIAAWELDKVAEKFRSRAEFLEAHSKPAV